MQRNLLFAFVVFTATSVAQTYDPATGKTTLPVRPGFPHSYAECDKLQSDWDRLSSQIDSAHVKCLDQNRGRPGNPEAGSGPGSECVFPACQDLHTKRYRIAAIAKSEVAACRQDVEDFKQEEQSRQDELAKQRQKQLEERDRLTKQAQQQLDRAVQMSASREPVRLQPRATPANDPSASPILAASGGPDPNAVVELWQPPTVKSEKEIKQLITRCDEVLASNAAMQEQAYKIASEGGDNAMYAAAWGMGGVLDGLTKGALTLVPGPESQLLNGVYSAVRAAGDAASSSNTLDQAASQYKAGESLIKISQTLSAQFAANPDLASQYFTDTQTAQSFAQDLGLLSSTLKAISAAKAGDYNTAVIAMFSAMGKSTQGSSDCNALCMRASSEISLAADIAQSVNTIYKSGAKVMDSYSTSQAIQTRFQQLAIELRMQRDEVSRRRSALLFQLQLLQSGK